MKKSVKILIIALTVLLFSGAALIFAFFYNPPVKENFIYIDDIKTEEAENIYLPLKVRLKEDGKYEAISFILDFDRDALIFEGTDNSSWEVNSERANAEGKIHLMYMEEDASPLELKKGETELFSLIFSIKDGEKSSEISFDDICFASIDENRTITDIKSGSGKITPEGGSSKEALSCKFSIDCNVLTGNENRLPEEKRAVIPENGIILEQKEVSFYEGESVFDVLKRACRENKIHMEFVMTPAYNSAYIEGINNLYEFDGGSLSGWMYSVNGEFPSFGCSEYKLSPGDTVEWKYTLDLGEDIK